MTCDDCGKILAVSDWPWCPHGRGVSSVVADGVPGGFLAENGFAEPRRFDSHSAHQTALAAEGLEIRAKWAGPHDKYLTRWDTVDLDAARILLERGPQARREKLGRWPEASIPIAVKDAGTLRQKVS